MNINDTETGTLAHGGNELTNDAKNDDPSAYRGGRPTPGILCKISGDLWFPDPNDPTRKIRLERVFVGLGVDDSGAWGGQFEVQAMLPGQHSDAATRKLLTVNTKQILCHVPLVALAGVFDTERPWPWEHRDDTHGIAPGDFDGIARTYGFPSEEQRAYIEGRMSWAAVIARQDVRDDFRHFPRFAAPAPPAVLPPVYDWLSPESQALRAQEIGRISAEFAPMPLDAGRVRAYMEGRNRNLAEVHDDEMQRAAPESDPCEGKNRVPLG